MEQHRHRNHLVDGHLALWVDTPSMGGQLWEWAATIEGGEGGAPEGWVSIPYPFPKFHSERVSLLQFPTYSLPSERSGLHRKPQACSRPARWDARWVLTCSCLQALATARRMDSTVKSRQVSRVRIGRRIPSEKPCAVVGGLCFFQLYSQPRAVNSFQLRGRWWPSGGAHGLA